MNDKRIYENRSMPDANPPWYNDPPEEEVANEQLIDEEEDIDEEKPTIGNDT